MDCINFDKQFEQYLAAWVKKNAAKYKNNMDVIEGMMPDVYMEFLAKPASWLGGVTPQDYFGQFSDAGALISLLCDYVAKKVPTPDLLLERIVELGSEAEEHLLGLVLRDGVDEEVEMTAISLLREMESTAPMQAYIDFIANLNGSDEKGDLCAEALLSMGEAAVGPILQALDRSKDAGRDVFADILSNYPGDDRIFDLLMERFTSAPDKRALFSSYLAKLGDDRALPALEKAAQDRDVSYLDYVEIVNAIEVLGGERPPEREFSGDPFYESLKRM